MSNFVYKGSFMPPGIKQTASTYRPPTQLINNFSMQSHQGRDYANQINNITQQKMDYCSIIPIDISIVRQIDDPYSKDFNKSNAKSLYIKDYSNEHPESNIATPLNAYNLIKNDVDNLIRSIDTTKYTKIAELTNTNKLDNNYNNENNRSMKVNRISEYTKDINFLDTNVIGTYKEITEYIININSVDRDCNLYPNPFNYKVFFNSSYTNNAIITRLFKNIKYIKLDNVSIPRRHNIINQNYNLYETNNNYNELFILFLSIKSNNIITYYEYYKCTITYRMLNYYFDYYQIIINNYIYYLTTYNIYIDHDFKTKINFFINNISNINIINNFFNNQNLDDIIFNKTLIEINNWIMIDIIDNKIKFTKQNNNFNEIISYSFELKYSLLNNEYIIDYFKIYILQDSLLEFNRYILLNIDDLNDSTYEYSTDQKIEKCFNILYNDYICGDYNYLETNYNKVYNHSNLGTINKMSIQFKDVFGKDITTSYNNFIDYDITTSKNTCICSVNYDSGEQIRNYKCCHSYLRHMGYEKLQNNLLFKIGIIEGTQNIQRF